ncbi:hypothetical protein PMAYCL1PPCAC_01572, partial [Pristionchus mayeri]
SVSSDSSVQQPDELPDSASDKETESVVDSPRAESPSMPMSGRNKMRSILDEKTENGEKWIKVQWESTWEPEGALDDPCYLNKLAILGVTRASFEEFKNDVTKWEFYVENNNVGKEGQPEVWTYEYMRHKAPELLLDLYEDKCQEFFSR